MADYKNEILSTCRVRREGDSLVCHRCARAWEVDDVVPCGPELRNRADGRRAFDKIERILGAG